MLNVNKYIENFESLIPENQLEVAEAIAKEVKDNTEFLDDDEYDKERSRKVEEIFDALIQTLKENVELKELADILIKYKGLSPYYKERVVNEIRNTISEYSAFQEQNKNELICNDIGHDFGKWEHSEITKMEENDNAEFEEIPYYCVRYKESKRTCKRCGFTEEVKKGYKKYNGAMIELHNEYPEVVDNKRSVKK